MMKNPCFTNLRDDHINLLDHIALIPAAIPQRLHLTLPCTVRGAAHRAVLPALRWRPAIAPAPPGISTEIGIERRVAPRAAAIGRDFDAPNAMPVVECEALHFKWRPELHRRLRFGHDED